MLEPRTECPKQDHKLEISTIYPVYVNIKGNAIRTFIRGTFLCSQWNWMKLHSFELKTTGKYQVLCLQTGVWTGVCVSGQGCACLDRGVPVWTGVCLSGQGCACLDRGMPVLEKWYGITTLVFNENLSFSQALRSRWPGPIFSVHYLPHKRPSRRQ